MHVIYLMQECYGKALPKYFNCQYTIFILETQLIFGKAIWIISSRGHLLQMTSYGT